MKKDNTKKQVTEKKETVQRTNQSNERIDKELTAIASVVNDMLRGDLDDLKTEKKVMDSCLIATDSVYGMIGAINEQGKYDTTTYSSRFDAIRAT